MTANGWLQIALYLAALLALVKPLGWYMARVYEGQNIGLNTLLAPVERVLGFTLLGNSVVRTLGGNGFNNNQFGF